MTASALIIGTLVQAPSGKVLMGAGWRFSEGVVPSADELAERYPAALVQAAPSIDSF